MVRKASLQSFFPIMKDIHTGRPDAEGETMTAELQKYAKAFYIACLLGTGPLGLFLSSVTLESAWVGLRLALSGLLRRSCTSARI
jgi:hypothetical protein